MHLFYVYGQGASSDYKYLQELIKRQIPWLKGKVVFNHIAAKDGQDVFEFMTKDDKLYVGASSKSAAGQALNWYLKYHANQMLSHSGDNIKFLERIPEVKEKETHRSWASLRHALNYCTHNYTMGFWGWKEWEKELDWMALNGVNVSLSIVGVEEVWYNVLKKLSFSDSEIDAFIPGPAYTAWWLMSNLEGWGGPVPKSMRKDRVVLQQQIIKRMHELGIEPELHGFYGMVPNALKKKMPEAKIVDQGQWMGFNRPAFLDPTDPLFEKIGDLYYTELKKLYGNKINYFGGDPFHEGGKTKGIDIAVAGKNIQQLMLKHYPQSTWMLMGWGDNPKTNLLEALDKRYTIVQDLFGEARQVWDDRASFDGTPIIWSIVSNFGGTEGMYGKLDRIINESRRAAHKYPQFFRGVGATPEGITDNPVLYDLLFTTPWLSQQESVHSFITKYPIYRYGKYNLSAEKAWKIFLETAYASDGKPQEGGTESILCARPSLTIKSVSTWGTSHIPYDPARFEIGVKNLLDAAVDFHTVPSYRFDLIDAVRQVVANKSQVFHSRMKTAYEQKDATSYVAASKSFLQLILLQDSLLAGDRRFMLSTWINQARSLGRDKISQDLSERNARMLITIWGPANYPATELHEYSHREWNGLLGTLYYDRWKRFIDQQQEQLEGKSNSEKPIDFFTIESEWANQLKQKYRTVPIHDYINLAQSVYHQVIAMD